MERNAELLKKYIKKPFYIGDVRADNNIFLAPMAGVCDRAFRTVCKMHGAGMVYSEMISAKAVTFGDKKTFSLER